MKVIIRLNNKKNPTEIKNLYLEKLSKVKVSYLDKLLEVTEDLDMK